MPSGKTARKLKRADSQASGRDVENVHAKELLVVIGRAGDNMHEIMIDRHEEI